MSAWSEYVRRVTGTDVAAEIARSTGINQSSVYRWLHDDATPSTAHAAKVAQVYEGNVLEAFVAAGFLTSEEAGEAPVDLSDVPSQELLWEVERRMSPPRERSKRAQVAIPILEQIWPLLDREMANSRALTVNIVRDVATALVTRFLVNVELAAQAVSMTMRIASRMDTMEIESPTPLQRVSDWGSAVYEILGDDSVSDDAAMAEALRLSQWIFESVGDGGLRASGWESLGQSDSTTKDSPSLPL